MGVWWNGTERITGNSFLVEVQKRDAQTLIPIIKDYIRDGGYNSYLITDDYLSNSKTTGSVIYSDEWRPYSGISRVPGKNYTHKTVNHSVNFVDPVTGITMMIIYNDNYYVYYTFRFTHTRSGVHVEPV